MRKQATPLADTTSDMSWFSLFDPLSALHGGGDRYPEFIAKMFPGSPKTAWRASKIGAAALLGIAATAAIKGMSHMDEMSKLRKYTEPDYNLKTQLTTTFNAPLAGGSGNGGQREKKRRGQRKTAGIYTVPHPEATSYESYLDAAVPAAVLMTAAALTYKYLDNKYDSKRNKELDASIVRKDKELKRLMQTRARVAKGTATPMEVKRMIASVPDADVITKSAREYADEDPYPGIRNVNAKIRLLLAGVGIAAAVGSYRYFKSSDPEQLKYKAYKKALETYAKSRAQGTPITILPSDASKYFADISKVAPAAAKNRGKDTEKEPEKAREEENVRDIPELTQSYKPLAITL